MQLLTTILIGLSLSVDSFAVSLSNGLTVRGLKKREVVFLPLIFGLFHVIMPILGYFLGVEFLNLIRDFDHWVAFGILTFLGVKLFFEKPQTSHTAEESKFRFCLWTLFSQAVATSLDALAIGLTFALIDEEIFRPAVIFGIIVFFVSLIGLFLGNKIPVKNTRFLNILAGTVLILIGLKILTEHLGIIL